MLFQSEIFIFLFLPLCLVGFHLFQIYRNTEESIYWLIACSAFFYGWHVPQYLALLFGSICANYTLATQIQKKRSRKILIAGLTFNISLLFYFKYTNFFIDTANTILQTRVGLDNVVLPLAISFFTFQQIAYLVDVYRHGHKNAGLGRYTLFVCFFPQLIAGPIVHHSEIFPQIRNLSAGATNRWQNFSVGATIFVIGLAKKLVIADSASIFVNLIFDSAAANGPVPMIESWIGAIAYSVQIYFDFSGYSDMAIGIARMFGIRLPVNFLSPYKARSIIEFWRRWHITLSRFLREYLYFPLGGNRHGSGRRYANLMIVMLLGGLWHGAGWNFVLWGGIHGTFLIVNQLWRSQFPGKTVSSGLSVFYWALTIAAICVAWVPFRAQTMDVATNILSGMFGFNGIGLPRSAIDLLGPWYGPLQEFGIGENSEIFKALLLHGGLDNAGWIVLGIVVALWAPNVYQLLHDFEPAFEPVGRSVSMWQRLFAWTPSVPWAAAIVLVFIFSVAHQNQPVEFLYFQF